MTTELSCPDCDQQIEYDLSLSEPEVECPACSCIIVVPERWARFKRAHKLSSSMEGRQISLGKMLLWWAKKRGLAMWWDGLELLKVGSLLVFFLFWSNVRPSQTVLYEAIAIIVFVVLAYLTVRSRCSDCRKFFNFEPTLNRRITGGFCVPCRDEYGCKNCGHKVWRSRWPVGD